MKPWLLLSILLASPGLHSEMLERLAYEEPGVRVGGALLDNLDFTTLYIHNVTDGELIEMGTFQASSPSGGAPLSVETWAPDYYGREIQAEIWATATDLEGLESGMSNSVQVVIDNRPGRLEAVEYTEPEATGLIRTDVHFQNVDDELEPIIVASVPATAPTGGGTVMVPVEIPVPADREVQIAMWATAVYQSGARSGRSETLQRIEDRLGPGAPGHVE